VVRPGSGEDVSNVDADPVVRDVEIVSSRAQPGALFACIKGNRSDGHDFAAEALARGAVALLCEQALELLVPQVIVPRSARSSDRWPRHFGVSRHGT